MDLWLSEKLDMSPRIERIWRILHTSMAMGMLGALDFDEEPEDDNGPDTEMDVGKLCVPEI
ncbi:hypothetical protein H2200_002488 [Cladophialophora chaetospira]|uniref:Uncharacterized protein n=1 Tax=Cladophialophora chaetospira TaxID=386627 RepID=A0AA38XJ05_9EURO|nr:hypothetical protein H2200_002488 [Cladophialophora chaetospira]